MRLIGQRCKRREAFSLLILIGRGLDLTSLDLLVYFALFGFVDACSIYNKKSGANGCEVPPVPIPNTEVKLTNADDTWLVTTRENRTVPEFSAVKSA